MKNIVLIYLLCSSYFVYSQESKYQNFTNTKWSIITPLNYVKASNINGFINKEYNSSISFKEFDISYEILKNQWNKQNLNKKGMNLIREEVINFNNSKASYFYVTQIIDGIKHFKQCLIFGKEKSIIIFASYPEKHKSMEDEIKTSLMSVSYINN